MDSDTMNKVVAVVGAVVFAAVMLWIVFRRGDDQPEPSQIDRAWSDLLAAGLRPARLPGFDVGGRVLADVGLGCWMPGVVTRAGLGPVAARVLNPLGDDDGSDRYMVRLDGRRRAEPFHASQLRPDNFERTPTLADIDQIVKGDQP